MPLTDEQLKILQQRAEMLQHYARVIGDLAQQLEAEMDVLTQIVAHGLKEGEQVPEMDSTFVETMGGGRVEVPTDQASQ